MKLTLPSKMLFEFMNTTWIHLIVFLYALASTAAAQITVFAASSTTEAMKEIGESFTQSTSEKVRFNFASSATLARQIEAGAPADIFISAHIKWMDYLEKRHAIQPDSRFNLAQNELVLVAEKGRQLAFDGIIPGRIATGDFKSVPVGMYAKEALKHMGWLDALQPKLIMGSNARTVLMYVERGETTAGIVYATDARASKKVVVVGTFPEASHSPILYPACACSEKKAAHTFLEFLKSPKARAIFTQHGFK